MLISYLLELIFLLNKEKYWADPKNRMKFFEDFAAEKGFDPLLSNNWNDIVKQDVINVKVLVGYISLFIDQLQGGVGVLSHYGNSLRKALMDVFPTFNHSKFALKIPSKLVNLCFVAIIILTF